MKKILTLVGIVALSSMAMAGTDLKINGDFKNSKLGAAFPLTWRANFSNKKDIGVGKIIATKEAGKVAFNVKTTKMTTPFYTGKAYPVKLGDKIEIEIKAKGKGKIHASLYLYDAKAVWFGYGHGTEFTVTPEEKEYKATINIEKQKNKIPAFVRVVFNVHPNSDVTISQVEAEIEDK